MHLIERQPAQAERRKSDEIRALGSLEQVFWLLDQEVPVHFAVTAQIAGRTSPRDWRRALDLVQMRHPLLSARIEGDLGWLRFCQTQGVPIPLKVVEEEPENRWEAEVGHQLAMPFNPQEAPLVRAVLIQGVHDAALIFAAHHSIADGMSLVYLVRDTLRALAGSTLDPLPLFPSQDEALGFDPVWKMGEADQVKSPRSEAAASLASPDNARPKVRSLRLPRHFTAKLRDRARQEETTVHGALCAALALAGRQVSGCWRSTPLRLLSPINIRSILGASDNCGVFLNTAILAIEAKATGFWHLARRVKSNVVAGQVRGDVEEGTRALRQVLSNGREAASELVRAAFAHEAMLTNLGSLPIGSKFGPIEVKALWGPTLTPVFEDGQAIGAATTDGSLHLTHTSCAPFIGLLPAMHGVLREMCFA